MECQMEAQFRGRTREAALWLCNKEIEAYKKCLRDSKPPAKAKAKAKAT